METAKVEVQNEFPQEQELKEKMEKLNQLNAELNIKIDENEIIDDFDDEKENDKSRGKVIKIKMMTLGFSVKLEKEMEPSKPVDEPKY